MPIYVMPILEELTSEEPTLEPSTLQEHDCGQQTFEKQAVVMLFLRKLISEEQT